MGTSRAVRARRAGRVVLRTYREVQPQVDARIAEFGPVSCKPGCDACCRLMPLTDVVQMVPVVEYLTSRDDWETRKPALIAAVTEHLVAVARTGLPDTPDHPCLTAWWELQLACPFLAGGLCSVHEVRPAVCRYHNAVTEPELCGGPAGTITGAVDLSPVEQHIGLVGASEYRELIAGTIPACFALACRALGVDFQIPDELIRAGVLLHAKVA